MSDNRIFTNYTKGEGINFSALAHDDAVLADPNRNGRIGLGIKKAVVGLGLLTQLANPAFSQNVSAGVDHDQRAGGPVSSQTKHKSPSGYDECVDITARGQMKGGVTQAVTDAIAQGAQVGISAAGRKAGVFVPPSWPRDPNRDPAATRVGENAGNACVADVHKREGDIQRVEHAEREEAMRRRQEERNHDFDSGMQNKRTNNRDQNGVQYDANGNPVKIRNAAPSQEAHQKDVKLHKLDNNTFVLEHNGVATQPFSLDPSKPAQITSSDGHRFLVMPGGSVLPMADTSQIQPVPEHTQNTGNQQFVQSGWRRDTGNSTPGQEQENGNGKQQKQSPTQKAKSNGPGMGSAITGVVVQTGVGAGSGMLGNILAGKTWNGKPRGR